MLCRPGYTGTQQKSFCLHLPNAEVQGHHSSISSPCHPPEVFAKLIFIQSISKGESRFLATGRDPEPESLFHLIYVVYLLNTCSDIYFIYGLINNACLKIRRQNQAIRGQAVVSHTFDPKIWGTETDGSL